MSNFKVTGTLAYNETVLLAMAHCQAKTDKSAEIIILGCTAETRQPQAIEAI
jgi:Asp/Glu/hydantoin racemase